jgi:hypothetical protein
VLAAQIILKNYALTHNKSAVVAVNEKLFANGESSSPAGTSKKAEKKGDLKSEISKLDEVENSSHMQLETPKGDDGFDLGEEVSQATMDGADVADLDVSGSIDLKAKNKR